MTGGLKMRKKYFIDPHGDFDLLHLTHPVHTDWEQGVAAVQTNSSPLVRSTDMIISYMSLDGGGKPTQTQGEHSNSTQKGPEMVQTHDLLAARQHH